MKAIKTVHKQIGKHTAFLIGNGPNLNAGTFPSWKNLLIAAAYRGKKFNPVGLSNTEVYDMVELHGPIGVNVKERVCKKLQVRKSMNLTGHRNLMEFAIQTNSPILTTNFDEAFETSVKAKLFHIDSKDFTHFYPWKTYYGFKQHQLPSDGFGIWKIHGDVRYKASIRLGLTDYMGSAERARALIHKGPDRLFNGKRRNNWPGFQTWLHIWFNMPIIIIGFGYNTDEIFLRWLLIERRRYFNSIGRPMDVHYITTIELPPSVKSLFKNIGVTIKLVRSYKDIYG